MIRVWFSCLFFSGFLCVEECGCVDLFCRLPEHLLAVGVKPHVPEAHLLHEALRLLQLALPPEERLDKFDARIPAKLLFLLARLEHRLLARLEQLAELVRDAFARLDEVLDHLPAFDHPNPRHALLGPLDLPRKLDEQEPHFTRHLGDRGRGAVCVDRPVVDPLAEAVGIEHGAKQKDRLLGWVPVLQ